MAADRLGSLDAKSRRRGNLAHRSDRLVVSPLAAY